jgi:GTP cyclohydrolase II
MAAVTADPKNAARAIDALRRGWIIGVTSHDRILWLAAIESAPHLTQRATGMLLSASRAATLRLGNQAAAASGEGDPVLIAAPENLDAGVALAIADPVLDLANPMKGPFTALVLPDIDAAKSAIELARMAGLLPAFLVLSEGEIDAPLVQPVDVTAFSDPANLHIAAHAMLPTASAENAQIFAYRSDADASDHIALVIGMRDANPPLVRLHSECLTGDVLGSLKCDCGPQLAKSLAEINGAGWGVLLYLRQEGRGIGLVNKLRAYALQDQGFDTVDANLRLGFSIDARDFATAGCMLKLLNIDKIKLLTNNPAKVAGLEAEGIIVLDRIALKIDANRHNLRYLDTKRDRTGHIF